MCSYDLLPIYLPRYKGSKFDLLSEKWKGKGMGRGREGERGRGGGGGGRGEKGKGEGRGGREREKVVALWHANRQIIDFKF